MDKTKKLCMGCMAPLEAGVTVCPHCAHDNQIPNPKGALSAGTILAGTYLVGTVIHQNDLTILYLGYHLQKNIRVYIEEFFPQSLACRQEDGAGVQVEEHNRIRYATLYSDLSDRWKRLGRMDSRCLLKTRELLQWGETQYRVTSYVGWHTLEEWLDEEGPMTWPQARTALMPLMTLVSSLHNQGMFHCGIAPDNILLSKRGHMVLTGFSLPEVRTVGSGLTAELYGGYSAPEQYSNNLWQGEWTDVYSLGAVLYRMLTGKEPLPALQRERRDPLKDAVEENPTIPQYVSDAIAKAMRPSKKDRYQSVDEFTAALLEESSSNTAVFHPEVPETKSSDSLAKEETGKRRNNFWPIALAVSAIVNLVLLGLLFSAPGSVTMEPEEPDMEQEEEVPLMEYQLVGVYYPFVQQNLNLFGSFSYEAQYEYNEIYPEDVIFEQSVTIGQPLPENETIQLKVSKGSQYVTMPYLIGSSQDFASRILTNLEVDYEFVYDFNSESDGIPGTVIASNKGYNARISREKDQVILTIKQIPEESEDSDEEESSVGGEYSYSRPEKD